MLNRTQCPDINPLTDFDIQMPERTIMPNGIPLNIIRAGNEEVVRMDILIGAGTWHQAYPLQALFTNRMLREGTRHMTSAEISEKLDFYGAWVELSTSMNCNFLTLYSLNKFFPQTLAILSAMMKEATFPEVLQYGIRAFGDLNQGETYEMTPYLIVGEETVTGTKISVTVE